MAKGKKGIFSRLIEGPERSEDYARKTLPTNRWALGWDLFKTNMGKMMKINFLMLIFLLPILAVFYFRSVLISGQASLSPFVQNIGIGYPAYPFITGTAESIVLNADVFTFIAIFLLSFVAAVGISGGFYVMRNLVWTEGVFVASDFWSGVKKNYKTVLPSTLLYVIVLAITFLSIDLSNVQIAYNPSSTVVFTISKVISWVFIVFFTAVYLFMLTLGVTYELKFTKLLRNALIFTIGLLPLNVFFMALALAILLFLLFDISSIFFAFGLIAIFVLGISLFTLIWTNYSQWAFDEFLNDKIAGAKKYRGIYKQNVSNDPEEFVYKKSKLSKAIKPVTDYDVEIAELPEMFTRADLQKLAESKKRMIEDSEKYAKEHNLENSTTDIDEFMEKEDK
jgi:uncharacterized membrane protein YesL